MVAIKWFKDRTRPDRFARQAMKLAVLMTVLLQFAAATGHPATANDEENYKVVQGLGVYLGVLPAGMVRGHPKGHPETIMHGGVPSGPHEYHIVVAVFDAATGTRIEDARVTATVSGLGHVGLRRFDLEPMTIAGTVTYGSFVNLPGSDRYDLSFSISTPQRPNPVTIDFAYEHLR